MIRPEDFHDIAVVCCDGETGAEEWRGPFSELWDANDFDGALAEAYEALLAGAECVDCGTLRGRRVAGRAVIFPAVRMRLAVPLAELPAWRRASAQLVLAGMEDELSEERERYEAALARLREDHEDALACIRARNQRDAARYRAGEYDCEAGLGFPDPRDTLIKEDE